MPEHRITIEPWSLEHWRKGGRVEWRVPVEPQPEPVLDGWRWIPEPDVCVQWRDDGGGAELMMPDAPYQPGDVLLVGEEWEMPGQSIDGEPGKVVHGTAVRLRVPVVRVGVERVRDVTSAGMEAEGVRIGLTSMDIRHDELVQRQNYFSCWQSAHPDHPWESAWCWTYTLDIEGEGDGEA